MSYMKTLYNEIFESAKAIKSNPCADTYTNFEKLLNRSIPSDGSEDVVKYQMVKSLLKCKAILLNNVASNDSIKYIFLWTTPDMIVHHFELQDYITLEFVQSNRFVQGDYVRGDYTVKATPSKNASNFTVVTSKKNVTKSRNNSSPGHHFTTNRNQHTKKVEVVKSRQNLVKSTGSYSDTKKVTECESSPAIEWGKLSTKSWADESDSE